MRPAVLLVDDDPVLLRLLAVWLGKCGYRVLPCLSAAEALCHWARERDRVSLLITDLDLGTEISGIELARQLSLDKRALRVLYISGGDFARLGPDRHESNCVSKPFSLRALTDRVQAMLDPGEAPVPVPDDRRPVEGTTDFRNPAPCASSILD